jgi:signal transduction histidine kinase
MMAKLGALMKRGWTGMSCAGTEAIRPVHQKNAATTIRSGGKEQKVVDLALAKAECLGGTFKQADPTLWPAEACRAVRELKSRAAHLEADNDRALSSGCLFLEPGLLVLDDVLRSVEFTYGPICRQKGLKLVVKNDPLLPKRLWGDERRLSRILEHLLDNALRFTPSGEIRVETHALSEVVDRRVRLRLSVRDTGIGISEKALEWIQELFVRIESGLSWVHPGSGLVMVGKLARLMDGYVHVESMEDMCTEVYCTVTLEVPSGE